VRVEVQVGTEKAAAALLSLSGDNGFGVVPAVNIEDIWVERCDSHMQFRSFWLSVH
jgi:hypothetical protein